MISVTVTQAQQRLEYLASIQGQSGATGRHPLAKQEESLLNAYRGVIDLLSSLGERFYLTESAEIPIPGLVSNRWYTEVDLPTETREIYGVDAHIGGTWYPLRRVSWSSRSEWQRCSRERSGTYVLWTLAEETPGASSPMRFTSQAAYDLVVYRAIEEISAIRDNDSKARAREVARKIREFEQELSRSTEALQKRGPLAVIHERPIGAYSVVRHSLGTDTVTPGKLALMWGWP